MYQNRLLSSLLVVQTLSLLCAVSLHAEEHAHRQHGTHEHGVAQLNIAREANRLQLELNSPAMNIVGFEHSPRNDQDRQAVAQAMAVLKDGTQLYVLTPAAKCHLIKVDIDTALVAGEHDKHEHGSSHADFRAEYVFDCQQISALTSMDVRLFEKFPATEDIDVQLLSDKGQTALELNAKNTRIEF